MTHLAENLSSLMKANRVFCFTWLILQHDFISPPAPHKETFSHCCTVPSGHIPPPSLTFSLHKSFLSARTPTDKEWHQSPRQDMRPITKNTAGILSVSVSDSFYPRLISPVSLSLISPTSSAPGRQRIQNHKLPARVGWGKSVSRTRWPLSVKLSPYF